MGDKITAVEWLVKKLNTPGFAQVVTDEEFQQALVMEKEQVIDAWEDGQNSFSSRSAEIYYNETFK
jgi:hypothetical protein